MSVSSGKPGFPYWKELHGLRGKVGQILIIRVLASKDFAFRGGYIERLQLALILLTGELPEGFNLSQPGTVLKARLMSKLIYSSKLVVLRHEIFRELGVRLMTSAQADLTEVCEVVDQVSSSG